MSDAVDALLSKNAVTGNYTDRGTKIIRPGEELDKNAFLQILAAELANQDPLNAKDGTEYVTQMAQFASIEQMSNLNSNMKFTGATALIGKYAMVNSADIYGNLYHGVITGVSRNKANIKVNMIVGEEKGEDGKPRPKVEQFNLEDIIELIELPEPSEDEKEPPKNGGEGEKPVEPANPEEENKVV